MIFGEKVFWWTQWWICRDYWCVIIFVQCKIKVKNLKVYFMNKTWIKPSTSLCKCWLALWPVTQPFLQCCQDDDVWDKLQESFRSRLMQTFHRSVTAPPSSSRTGESAAGRPQQTHHNFTAQEQEVMRSKLTEMRKRLRKFLVGTSQTKRMKTDDMEEWAGEQTPPPPVTCSNIRTGWPLTSQ